MVNFRAKASLFRENAEKIRIRIDGLMHEESRIVFRRLADDYDRLANTYDEMERNLN